MHDVLVYIVNSTAWSIFGFGAGWVACRFARDVHHISERAGEDDADDT